MNNENEQPTPIDVCPYCGKYQQPDEWLYLEDLWLCIGCAAVWD